MIYAGIDASLTSTGLVIGSSSEDYESYLIKPHNKMKGPRRLGHNRDAICELLYENDVTFVAMEDFAHGAKFQAHQLGTNQGVIRLAIYEMGLPLLLVGVNTLKMFVTGKGKASKDVMIKEVFKNWGFDTESNDLADAFAVRMFLESYMAEKWTKKFRGMVKKDCVVLPPDASNNKDRVPAISYEHPSV